MSTTQATGGNGGGRRPRRWRRWVAAVAAVVAVVLVLAYAGVSYAVYDGLSAAKGGCWPEYASNTPDQYSVAARWGVGISDPYQMPTPQDVAFRSRDAALATTDLAAWWIPADGVDAASAPAVVLVHGIKSCRR
jgi:hypothetical protein